MASFNKVILVGNLTRDPELRYTSNGEANLGDGLAVNRTWTSESGEKKEEVTFVDVDIFGRTAENVGQYMRKGSPILIEGRLRLDQWDDKQTGQKRSRLGVVAETESCHARCDCNSPRESLCRLEPPSTRTCSRTRSSEARGRKRRGSSRRQHHVKR